MKGESNSELYLYFFTLKKEWGGGPNANKTKSLFLRIVLLPFKCINNHYYLDCGIPFKTHLLCKIMNLLLSWVTNKKRTGYDCSQIH